MIWYPSTKVSLQPYVVWNPWTGCDKISPACKNCFIKDFTFKKRQNPTEAWFDNLINKNTIIVVCLNSDFFWEKADTYRDEIWAIIKKYPDLLFKIITKRVERIPNCLPQDWGTGYPNVWIAVTTEDQEHVNLRLPLFLNIPCRYKSISCTPCLSAIDLSNFLKSNQFIMVEANTEDHTTLEKIRPTKYEWLQSLKEQCIKYNVCFGVTHIGSKLIMPDNSIIQGRGGCYSCPEVDILNLSYYKKITFSLKNTTITR